MNHFPFIVAAYAITFLGTIGVTWASFRAMRKAEARADAIRDRR